ncbi:MAG TPA: DUF2889 domain-containing protein [Pseudomonadales bacterium]|nr:DUF2889 domain-containing protein [Pseudomonadales bacterium]
MAVLPDYPRNPLYGSGTYRRRIRLEQRDGCVFGALEDTNHGFSVTVYHDGAQVTAVEADARRIPYTSCPGAVEPIKGFVGASIHASLRDMNFYMPASSNCTHLFDLTVMAIRHAACAQPLRQWDITVTDQTDSEDSVCTVLRDGEQMFCWKARDLQLTEPAEFAGKPFYLGFGKWASQRFSGDELEAAFTLQKGYFVALARCFDIDKMAGEPASQAEGMRGACYTYSDAVIAKSEGVRTVGTMRDFSDCEEKLLKFL